MSESSVEEVERFALQDRMIPDIKMLKPELIIRNGTNYEKTILIIGVFHGDEPQGEYFINEYLKTNPKSGKNRVFYMPRLNSSNIRTNQNGVDLNRNFPTQNWMPAEKNEYWGGSHPESEAETKFLVDLINKNKFDAIITIHAPYKIINYDGKQSLPLANKISEILNYPLQEDIGYPTPGSFGTYCGLERNIPTITIETGEEIKPEHLREGFFQLFEFIENFY